MFGKIRNEMIGLGKIAIAIQQMIIGRIEPIPEPFFMFVFFQTTKVLKTKHPGS
jgi:hypothetical protein